MTNEAVIPEPSDGRPYMEAGDMPLSQMTESLLGVLGLAESALLEGSSSTDNILGALLAARIIAGRLHVRVPS